MGKQLKVVGDEPTVIGVNLKDYVAAEKAAKPIVSMYEGIERLWNELEKAEHSEKRTLEMLTAGIERLQVMGSALPRVERFAAELNTAIGKIEPDEIFDDGNIKPAEISHQLSLLLDSFPTSNVPNKPIYFGTLLQEIIATEADMMAIYGACRKIRTTCKFTPSISEVLEAVSACKAQWRKAYDAMDYAPVTLSQMIAQRDALALKLGVKRVGQDATPTCASSQAAVSQSVAADE